MTEGVDEPYYCPICGQAWTRWICSGCKYEEVSMVTDEQIKFIVDTVDDPDSDHTWGEIRAMIKKIWWEEIEEVMIERIYYKYKDKGIE